MTIGQLAGSAGIPTSTIRFYERAGLLSPEQRTAGNYRAYSQRSVERVSFIRAAQAVGLRVKDIAQLLNLDAIDSCADVQELLQRRLEDIRQRMKQLRHIERTLAAALQNCCKGRGPGICERVQALGKKKFRDCA